MADDVKSVRVAQSPTTPNLYAPMTFVGGLPQSLVHGFEIAVVRSVKPFLNILMELTRVAFEGQNVVSPLRKHSFGNSFLAAHRVNAHDTARHIQTLEPVWNSRNFVGFRSDLTLAQ
jgi:hypothetical protein